MKDVRECTEFGRTSTADEVLAGHNLSGQTIIVTGGSSGIGRATVRALASVGATVFVAVRHEATGQRALAGVPGDIRLATLDLSSLRSVREFATQWGTRPLHLLVANAGVMNVPLGYTVDGIELHLAINHLGHFLLAYLLSPSLERVESSRVIAVSSSAHRLHPFDFDDPNFSLQDYDPRAAYGRSKSANALFALAFDRRKRSNGIRAVSVMPGVIRTPIMRHMSDPEIEDLFARLKGSVKTIEQGASTTVWAAVTPTIEDLGGSYLEDCAPAAQADGLAPGRGVADHARDEEAADRLWRWSCAAVGIEAR